jgi:hypothetical protein
VDRHGTSHKFLKTNSDGLPDRPIDGQENRHRRQAMEDSRGRNEVLRGLNA